uniref:Uncharacterized protein n=1 Tax=Alexandrium catenella TaxID=2925 RepID=A0A7S1Q267_ALECA
MALRRALAVAALAGVSSAISDDTVLLQTGRAVEAVGPQFDVLMNATVNLDDEATVQTVYNTFLTLKKDVKTVYETDSPGSGLKTHATEKDVQAVQDFVEGLSKQLRETKFRKMPVFPTHVIPPKPSVKRMQKLVAQLRKQVYPPSDEVAHIVASNKAMCVDGPTLYIRKVLKKLRGSPLKYGWTGSQVEHGECKRHGFRNPAPDSHEAKQCYRQASVWVPSTLHGYNTFTQSMSMLYRVKEHKNTEDVHWEMQHVCLEE